MELQLFETHEMQSAAAAALIINTVKKDPAAVFCFATGDSPRRTYELLAERAAGEKIDFSKCTLIGLDEWMGVDPANTGSCHCFLQTYLIKPLGLSPGQVHLFDAMATVEQSECEKMDQFIREKGGIDCMLVGVGMNGHIGFNEPGTSEHLTAHVIGLDPITLTVGQKYFTDTMQAKKGITLGLKQVMEARMLLMMANGKKKAGIIQQAAEGAISNKVPASLIRQHHNGILMLDSEAASALKQQ